MSSDYEEMVKKKNKIAEDELERLRTQLSEKGLTTELLYESLVQMTGECNTAMSTALPLCTFTQGLLESADNLTEEQIEFLQVLNAAGAEMLEVLRRIRSLTSTLQDTVLWGVPDGPPDDPASDTSVTEV